MATEGQVHTDKTHLWHMEQIAQVCNCDPQILLATNYRTVELDNSVQRSEVTDWWLEMTQSGGEGMVINPWILSPITKNAYFSQR